MTSSTWRDGLGRIARFSRLTADMTVATIEQTDEEITLVLRWGEGTARPADESVDAVLASIVRPDP